MIDAPPARALFNKSFIPVGVLLEGNFTSVFKNRMVQEFGLPSGTVTVNESKPSKMMFFSNSHLIVNKVSRSGFNK